MRIGILGGSFNPPHRGHLAVANTVQKLGLVDQVCLIPAATPPHKTISGEVAASVRLEMATLLAQEDAGLCVDAIELHRSGPSFTIDTIQQLKAKYPAHQYRIIIGSDLAKTFATWRGYRELLTLAPPLIVERPDAPFQDQTEFTNLSQEEITSLMSGCFSMEPVAVSSTKVRARIARGASDVELLQYLTAPVLAFVRQRRLYV